MKKFLLIFFAISSLIYSQIGWQVKNPEIYFLDSKIGWILVAVKNNNEFKSITIKTTNAGETWEIQKIDTFYRNQIWFYNDTLGYAKYLNFSYPDSSFPLYKTTNKGLSWQKNPFANNDIKSFYFFNDGYTGYGIQYITDSTNTQMQYFSRTTNGGINWDTVYFLGNSSRDYHYIGWVLNSDLIIRIGLLDGWPFEQILSKSSDSGKTWNYIIGFNLGDLGFSGINGFCFADQKTGYFEFSPADPIGGPKGRYKTTDGGTTWLMDSSYIGFGTLFVDSLVGFKTGSHKLYRTTDKGVSWDTIFYVGDSSYFSSFTFVDEYNGFAQKSIVEDQNHWRNEFCKTTDGGYTWSCSPIVFDTSAIITSIQEPQAVVTQYKLEQNYPNPFNPSTKISFSLPEGGLTTIKVYDILGEEKASLLNEYKQAGSYTTTFVGKNLPSGVYIYTITSGSFKQSRKMLLMK